jgi:hypothetical protein
MKLRTILHELQTDGVGDSAWKCPAIRLFALVIQVGLARRAPAILDGFTLHWQFPQEELGSKTVRGEIRDHRYYCVIIASSRGYAPGSVRATNSRPVIAPSMWAM